MARALKTDNTAWRNLGWNPVPGCNFMLRVEVIFDLPCKSVHAFSREMEYELIQEGGLNDYVHMRRKPISKPFFLEVERYIGVDYVDPLPLGVDLLLPMQLVISRYPNHFEPVVSARTYYFTGCTVTKKVYGALEANQSGLMSEITTIAYREMLCIDNGLWSGGDAQSPPPADQKASVADEAARAEAAKKTLEKRQAEAAKAEAKKKADDERDKARAEAVKKAQGMRTPVDNTGASEAKATNTHL